MEISKERLPIIKEVLFRMDEICPAEDVNIVEGELIDSLLDNALIEFQLIADIDKIPNIRTRPYPFRDEYGQDYTINNGSFTAPKDFERFVSVSCPEWKRILFESDLSRSTSLAWKISSFKFHEASALKPTVTLLPQTDNGQFRFVCKPYTENSGIEFRYVYHINPEELLDMIGSTHGYWQAYVWYVAYVTLNTMGQLDTAPMALVHAQAYQVIPNGIPSSPAAK